MEAVLETAKMARQTAPQSPPTRKHKLNTAHCHKSQQLSSPPYTQESSARNCITRLINVSLRTGMLSTFLEGGF